MNEQNEKENLGEQEEISQNRQQAPSSDFRQYWSAPGQQRAQAEPPRETVKAAGAPSQNNYAYRPYPQQGYGRPPYPQNNPYQYSATSGWQQDSRYQWNFDEYEQINQRSKGKRKKNRGLVVFAVSLLCVFSVGFVCLSGYSIWQSFTAEEDAQQSFLPYSSQERAASDSEAQASSEAQMAIAGKPHINETVPVNGRMTIPQVAKAVAPSVVGVVQYRNAYLFEPAGVGSGIIMSEDGYIITNAHVVWGADAIQVVLDSGDSFEAKLVGSDTRTDLAVLKIDAKGLSVAQFGDSDELEVGETVVAIGNPTGMELAGSVTRGIISAVNRVVKTSSYSMNFIQTDAAINPGNSGGALVNEFGQVIGINSAKVAEGGYEGIGFAIPITQAKPIIDDLVRNGRVTGRVVLGITARTIDEATAKTYNVPMGLQVIEVQNEDIQRKGVQSRDIITQIDDVRIHGMDDVVAALKEKKAGDVVRLTVFRQIKVSQNSTFEVEVILKEDNG